MPVTTESPVSSNPYAGMPNNGDVPHDVANAQIDQILAQNNPPAEASATPQSPPAGKYGAVTLPPGYTSDDGKPIVPPGDPSSGFVSKQADISSPASGFVSSKAQIEATPSGSPAPKALPNSDFVSQKANIGPSGPDSSNFVSQNAPLPAQQAIDAQPDDASTVQTGQVTPGYDANAKLDMSSGGTPQVGKPDSGLDKAIYDTAANVATSGRVDTTMGNQTSVATPEQVKALADSPKNLYQLQAQNQISPETLDSALMLRGQQWNGADPAQKLLRLINTGAQLAGTVMGTATGTVTGELDPLLNVFGRKAPASMDTTPGGFPKTWEQVSPNQLNKPQGTEDLPQRGPLLQGMEEGSGALFDAAGRNLAKLATSGVDNTTPVTPGGFPKTWEQVGTGPKDPNAPEGPSPTMGINPNVDKAAPPATTTPASEASQANEAALQKDTRTGLSIGSNLLTSVEHAGQAIAQNTGDLADTAAKVIGGPSQSINKWLGLNHPEDNLFDAYGFTLRGLPYEQMPLDQRLQYNAARVKQIQDDGTELAGNADNVNHIMDYLTKASGHYTMSPLELKAYGQEVDPTAIQAASLGLQILATHNLPEIPGFGPLVDHLSEGAINGIRAPVRAADLSFKLASAAAKNETALNVIGGLGAINTAWHAIANGDFDLGTMTTLMGTMGGAALGARFAAKSKAVGVFLDHLGAIAAKGDQVMATAADEASAGRPFFGSPTGDIGKWIPPWLRDTGEAIMPSGKMELAGHAGRLAGGILGQTTRAGISSALMAPAFTQEPEDAAKMVGQMMGYGFMGAVPGAAASAFHAPFDHLFTPKYGSLIPGKYSDAAPFRGFGTNASGAVNAPFRPYGTDAEADRVDKSTISMFPQDTQNRINNLRQLGSNKWQVHVFDDQSMDNVMQAHTAAQVSRIDQQIAQAQQANSDAIVRGDTPVAQTHADTIQQLQKQKADILTQPAAGATARGFFFNNGPDGTGPMQAYVRHSSVESALGHEGLGHPVWNIMQAMDAKNGTTYAPDFLNAAKRTTNMDTFANDYVRRISNGGITDATYNNLPPGISQDGIDAELAAEHGAGLLDGAPASLFTKNPSFQRSLTMGVGSALEHVLGIPVTGMLARHEFDGFQGSVGAALKMDQAIRAMSTDPSTIRPWQAKIEKIAKSTQPIDPDEAAAQSLAKGGRYTVQQARDIIAKSKQQGSPNGNQPPVKYTPAQNARAILVNPNAQGFTEDEANRHVPDNATNIGKAVMNARKSILAERKAAGIPSPDEQRAAKDAADNATKAAQDKVDADAQAQANKAEVQNNLANPEWVSGMEAKHGLKPGSMVAADNGAIHANRLDESPVTLQKGQPIQEGHLGNTPKSDADKVVDDYNRAKQDIENEFNKKGSIQKPDGSVIEANEHLDDELSPDEPAPGKKAQFMPDEPSEDKPKDKWADKAEAFKYNAEQKNRPEGTPFVSYRAWIKDHPKEVSPKATESKIGPSVPKIEPPQASTLAAAPPKPEPFNAASAAPLHTSKPTGTVIQRPDGTWSLHVGSDERGMTPHVRRFASEQGAKNAAATLRSKYGNALMDEATSAKVWGKEAAKGPSAPTPEKPPTAPKATTSKEPVTKGKTKPEEAKGAQGNFGEPYVSPGPGTEITSKGVTEHQPRKKRAIPPVNQNLPNAPGPVPGAPAPAPPVAAAPGILTPIIPVASAPVEAAPKETNEHTVEHQKALVEEGHSPGRAQKIVSGETPKIAPSLGPGHHNIGAYGYAGDASWDHGSLRGVGAFGHVSKPGSLIEGYSAGLTKEGAVRRGLTHHGQEFYGEDGNLYRWDDTAPTDFEFHGQHHHVNDDYIDVYSPHHPPDHGVSAEQIASNEAYMAKFPVGQNGKRGPINPGDAPAPALNDVEGGSGVTGESKQPSSDIKPPANTAVPSPLPAPIDVSKPSEPLKNVNPVPIEEEAPRQIITPQTIEDAQATARQQVTSKPGTQAYDNAVDQHMLMNLGAQHAASLAPGDTRVTYDPESGYTTGTHFVTDGSDHFHNWLLQGQTPQVMQTLDQIQSAISGKRDLSINYGSAVQKETGLPTGGQRVAAQENAPAKARESGLADIQSANKNIMPTYVGVTMGKNGKANSVIYGGISPDKVAGNAATITHALGAKSPYPVAPLGDKGVAEMDAKGFLSNHANGWDGTGQKKLVPAPGQEADVSQEAPGFEPYNMSQKKSDFWNLAVQGKDAQLGKGKKAAKAFEMAKLNSGYSSQGYTNKTAHQLDMEYGPQPKMVVNPEDPSGPNIQAKDKAGKPVFENWTENKLHSGYEMLRAALTGKIHTSGEQADEPIHPGHPALTQAMQEKGLPNTRAIKAGFMPGDTVEAKGERERISAAAVRTGRGAMYTAPNHHDAVVAAMDAGEPQDPRGWKHGYTTIPTEEHPDGRFLPREGIKESSPEKGSKVDNASSSGTLSNEERGRPIGDNKGEAYQTGEGGQGIAEADAERLGTYRKALQGASESSDRIDRVFRQGGKPHAIDAAAEESAKQIPVLRKLAEERGELLSPMDREPDAHGSEHQVWFSDDGKTATKETYYRSDPAHGERKRFGAVPTLDASDVRDATPYEYLDRLGISNEMGRKTRVVGVVDQGNGETRIRTEEPTISDAVGHPSMDDISDYMAKRGFQPKEWTSWYNPETKVLASDAQPRNFLKTDHGIYPVDTMLRHADSIATPLTDADKLKKNEQQRSHLEKQQAKLDTTKPEEDMAWEIMASKIHDLEREHQRLSESIKEGQDQENAPRGNMQLPENVVGTKAMFMPGDLIEKNGERERIKTPAVKFPSGQVYEGVHHPDAQENGIKDGHFAADALKAESGFTTEPTAENPDGRFVGMHEGWKIGKESSQLHPDVDPNKGFLNSEDLADYPHPEDREPKKAHFMPPDNALPVEYAKNKDGSQKLDKDGKPKPVKINFDLSKAPRIADKQPDARMPEDTPNTMKSFDYLTENQQKQLSYQDKVSATGTLAKRAAVQLKKWLSDPAIESGKDWYESMRGKLAKAFKDDHEMFTHLLGVTSPRENPHENFLYALEAYERLKKGDFARHIDLYQKAHDMMKSGDLVQHVKDLTGEKGDMTDADAMARYIHHHDILPTRENGKLYGTHGNGILRAISERWLDEPGGPKTKNYAGNLFGTTNAATIDSWAARFVRQLGYDGEKQWRIQPKSEIGVSDYDFAFAQRVFDKAAKSVGISPDAVQACCWFGLKLDWEKNGWMKGMGGEASSLDTPFDIAHPEGPEGPRLTAVRTREILAEQRAAAAKVEKEEKAAAKKEARKASKLGPPIPSMAK